MKTYKYHLIFFFILLPIFTKAQNAFHDAQFLVEARTEILKYKDSMAIYLPRFISQLQPDEKETVAEINRLNRFIINPYSDSVPIPKIDKAKKALREIQPLMKKLQNLQSGRFETSRDPVKEYNTNPLRHISGASLTEIPSTSLLSASQIIDGTALFIKKRVREELKLAFLNQFREKMDKTPLLTRLMPATYRTFVSVAELDEQMPSLNNVALNAFQMDIEQLPEHIEAALLYDTEFEDLRHDPNFKYFALPFNTLKHLQLGSHPAFALQDLQSKYFRDKTELDRIMQTMIVLNDNLRATELPESDNNPSFQSIQTTFIPYDKWASLRKKGGDSLFMALIYRNFKDSLFTHISSKSPTELRHDMQIMSENMGDYLSNLNSFETLHAIIKDENNRQNRDSLALQLTWNIMQLVDKSHLIYFSMLDRKAQDSYKNTYWLTYKPIAEATLKAAASLQKRNYAGVVLNTFQILRGVSNIPSLKNRNLFQQDFLKEFFFYSNFMTDILTAYNSEEVSNILDRYAAPVGSYSLKRRAQFSVSLNAYPGLFVALEDPFGTTDYTGIKRWSSVSGVTSPLGVAFNWGGFGKKKNQNISLFLSAIDIGAVLSYRWANDSAEGLPYKVEWAQVVAPGAHFMYGFANLPLTLSLGYQISPRLRQVSNSNNIVSNRNFERFSFALTADITIFNFYRKGSQK